MRNRQQAGHRGVPPLTVSDLIAGAGELTLGFDRAGFRNLRIVENSEAFVETFTRNLVGNPVREEITTDSDFPRPSVIVVGPPYQGGSLAGMREAGDVRNSLVSVFSQIVERVSTEAFVFEYVEGFLRVDDGERV